jgi:hypothetical protein
MFNIFRKNGKSSNCCNVKIEEVKEEKDDCCKDSEKQECCSAEDEKECS